MPVLREIGRYRIEQPPIGQGGMGIVYKAYDSVTRSAVAIKTLKGTADPESLQLFQKEWTILATLSHPNIVDIRDIGELTVDNERRPYFVMPLLPGTTLDKLIKASDSVLTPERVVEIISQACRGLQAAHDQRVVHRDLKPSNLFVLADDTVKIIDFGIVHLADSDSRTGIKGTLPYMAPEQLDLKPSTSKSDIFSLGVVCYEALTGRKPFERPTADETVEAIRHQMPLPISDLNAAVNDQTSRVVQKALAKQPYHRFTTVREFGDALRQSLRNEALDLFDRSRIQPRLNRVKKALGAGDYQLGIDILNELESEGNIDPEISLLRMESARAIHVKSIQQLLEDARTRMEEEEYPLALQKVQSVLELSPDNIDALALKSDIEHQRSVAQIDKWFQITQQHLENRFFAKARQAAEEILKIDPANKSVREMLAEISRGEENLSLVRKERQQLYNSAHKAYSNGELSSALRLLERVIELGKSTPSHPNTDARYLEFYEQVRREHDEFASAYVDGKRALALNDFEKALAICNQILSRRPSEPLFQSLKIEVEDVQRQQNSAAVANLHSQIEAELDLERKFGMLKNAVKQFPGEQAFVQSFNVIKARRNLVNDIARRARQYEAQGQFIEASNQWETLRTIYKQYPGLDYELQRLGKKQEEYLSNQAKATLVEKVDRALVNGEYDYAKELLTSALPKSPADDELLRLMQEAEKGVENGRRAQLLLEEGQKLAPAGDHLLAIEKLRAARQVEPGNQRVTRLLNSVLIEYSRLLAEKDWRSAASFLEEALDINPDDPGAAGVSQLISDMRQRERIDRYVEEAWQARRQGRLEDAIAQVELGLRENPAETRLLQLRRELKRQGEFNKAVVVSSASQSLSAAPGLSEGPRPIDSPLSSADRDQSFAQQQELSIAAVDATNLFDPSGPVRVRGGAVTPDRFAANKASSDSPFSTTPWREPGDNTFRRVQAWILQRRVIALLAALILIWGIALTIAGGWSQLNVGSAKPKKFASTRGPQSPAPDPPREPKGNPIIGTDATPPPNYPPKPARVLMTSVHFDSEPRSARVKADNDETLSCITPCELQLANGRHTFSVSAPGFSEVPGIVQVPEERSKFASLSEDQKSVRIASVPAGVAILVDGKPGGETPITLKLSVGKHSLTFKNDGVEEERLIEVTEKDPQWLMIKLSGDSSDIRSSPHPPDLEH